MVAELLFIVEGLRFERLCAAFFSDHSVLSKRAARHFVIRLLRSPERLPPEPLLLPELDFFEPEPLPLLLSLMTMRVVEPEEAAESFCLR